MPPKAKRLTKKEQQALARRQLLSNANAVPDFMVDFKAFDTFQTSAVDESARLRSLHAQQLTPSEQDQIERLFCDNMQKLYEDSTWGFDLAKKRVELFEDAARYIIVERTPGQVDAFLHFRFVEDEGDAVVYVYEIQVGPGLQRQGLGKRLMQLLQLIGRKYRMKLILLTVFKTNVAAMTFYTETLGFDIDDTSPSAHGDMSESYEILSKSLV
ncbi:hypothetical protein H257_02432 [Aphanomyces astaci]|uniref:N-alpha-acetyltransferase 40 n=1 Tax=Aphanomyces astaci TaxID=112090 RepID=W4H1V7_APHAT|nr:hypothetical protein H257_02432 [Aphanomyces astaci]ETV85892.1 hypothetical protein H257_02432 [Aphanomyces astaci]RQM23316.1 hypothetical protein B5M09_000688 [Aphanomyces astaci]|eukprot:XP_009824364.1 hypothetical protein H257_02432 [Aphanomyces astaci]